MYAVEFDATVRDGKIEIPVEYMSLLSSNVKVILLSKEQEGTSVAASAPKESGFGSLSRYANPALWGQESNAWERAAVEKHEAR